MQESAIVKKLTVQVDERGNVAQMTERVRSLAASEGDLDKAQQKRMTTEQASQRLRDGILRQAQMMEMQQRATAAAEMQRMQAQIAANDNFARSSSHVSDVLRIATKTAVDHAASWAATAGAVGAGVLIFGSLLAVLGPIVFVYKAIKEAVTLVAEAWELGAKRLAEYRDIAAKAAATDLSTDFFQRITKAATDAKLPVDDLTAAFKKLSETSTEKLGGSALQTRLDALTKAGNFEGNTGAGQLTAANNQEQRFKAIVALIDQAMMKGERLAALDLAGTALGPAIADNLRKDSDYLNKMVAAADKLAATEIVSAADVGRALALQSRYDAAVKLLEQRWHPIQDLLTAAGVKMQTAWVGIVESVAAAVDWATKLVLKIGEIPQTFWDYLKKGANIAATGVSLVAPAIPVIGPIGGAAARMVASATSETEVAAVDAKAEAYARLAAGLRNANATQQAMAETNAVQSAVFKDTSKAIDTTAKAAREVKDALDRALDSIEKYIAITNAAAKSVDDGIFAQQKAKTIAELTAAAMRDGKTDLQKYAAEWENVGNRAGAAAQALAIARVDSQIRFGRQTSLLSPEDVAIANQLKGLYPDVATALDSVQASGLRTNAALSGLSSSISGQLSSGLTEIAMGTKSVSQGFSDMGISIARSIEEMIIKMYVVIPLMRALQASVSAMGFGFGGSSEANALASGIMPVARGAAFAGGNVIPFASGGIVSRPTLFPMANGTGLMGEAGPEAVMPLRRGSDGKLGVAARGGGSTQVTVNLIEDSSRAGQTDQKQNDNGGLDLTVFVDAITAKNAANPGSATSRILDNRKRVASR